MSFESYLQSTVRRAISMSMASMAELDVPRTRINRAIRARGKHFWLIVI